MYGEGRGKGYIGNSMSVNAMIARSNDSLPMSDWRKSTLLDLIEENYDKRVKKMKGSYKHFLVRDGWHHTGYFYNETTFYKVDDEAVFQGIENGDIVFYTDEERDALREKEHKEYLAELEADKLYRQETLGEQMAMEEEIKHSEYTTRKSKRGNTVYTFHITENEPVLFEIVARNGYLQLKDLAKAVGREVIELEIRR